MNTGSIAIAVRAEYGEFCPTAISLSGKSWTNENPASASHAPNFGRSPISPMPQLSRDGIEKSGTSTPACRPRKKSRGTDVLQDGIDAARKRFRVRQQAHDEERLMRKIKKVSRMHDDRVTRDQVQRELLFGRSRRDAKHRRPPRLRMERAHAMFRTHTGVQRLVVAAD